MRDTLHVTTDHLKLTSSLVPWDTEAFGFPVGQITELRVGRTNIAEIEYDKVWEWVSNCGIRILSCRLPTERLNESMFLEAQGFRFIEMVLHPYVEELDRIAFIEHADSLSILPATGADLPVLESIALQAFQHERYYVDPRLDSNLSGIRYSRWVRSSMAHHTQKLLKILDGARLIAFFIVEVSDGIAHWHLTAVAPEYQGHGYGKRVWCKMMEWHRRDGVRRITTTISARNARVLNLYTKLGFRFNPPEVTFHWVHQD